MRAAAVILALLAAMSALLMTLHMIDKIAAGLTERATMHEFGQ